MELLNKKLGDFEIEWNSRKLIVDQYETTTDDIFYKLTLADGMELRLEKRKGEWVSFPKVEQVFEIGYEIDKALIPPDELEKAKRVMDDIKATNNGKQMDILIPGYAARKIVSYYGLLKDLLTCKDALILLAKNEHSELLIDSLYHTFIILYGKCFTDGSAGKHVKLETDIFDVNHPDLLVCHEELMNIRHNYVAHRGKTDHDFPVPFFRVSLPEFTIQSKVHQLYRNRPADYKFPIYNRLIDYVLAYVEAKWHDAAKKAWQHINKAYTKEQMTMLVLNSPTDIKSL
jgi:hypothetical protein